MKRLLVLTAIILRWPSPQPLRRLADIARRGAESPAWLALEEYPGYGFGKLGPGFCALGREVFNIVLVKDDQSVTVHVDVPREVILGEEEYQQLVQVGPMPRRRTPSLQSCPAPRPDVELDDEPIEAAPISIPMGHSSGRQAVWRYWLVGGLALYLKRR